MGNFQGGGNRGGGFRGGNGGGGRPFRGNDRREVSMHKAVCDECQKSCEVPFRPSGDKPVYCNDCFSGKKGNDDRGPRKDFGNDRGPRKEFDRPAPFAKAPAPASDDMKNQFREINSKLDRLVTAIEKLSVSQAPKAEVKTASKTVAKVAAKKAVAKKSPAKKKK